MDKQFIDMIDEVNGCISSFNDYLKGNYQIDTIDKNRLNDSTYCVKVTHGNWDGFRWPAPEDKGVYFLFADEATDSNNLGLYIGKASFDPIGKRLYSHFNKDRQNEYFIMKDNHGKDYKLEYIIAIGLKAKSIEFMASSLEEYLISNLKSKLHLLNGTGNN